MRPVQYSLAISVSIMLLGAGCPLTKPILSPNIAEPLSQTLVERPIAQRKGFGSIPTVELPRQRPATPGTVTLAAEFPTIQKEVTVLRVETGRPNDPQLRNLAGLFKIPNDLIGSQPVSRELTFDWTDEAGIHWTYHASSRRVDFVRDNMPRPAASVTSWPARGAATDNVLAFLAAHGISSKRYGNPYLEPDWPAWMESQAKQGRCMTAASITAIRNQPPASMDQRLPELPFASGTACRTPEFPSRILVRLNATQDAQGIFQKDGAAVQGATIAVDATSGDVIAGWLTLAVDPERSDYPAISAEDARYHLLSGGQGGMPRGDVTITKTSFEWMGVKDLRIPQTDYLYPAIVGHGTIVYPDQTTGPYRIVVPLVKNE